MDDYLPKPFARPPGHQDRRLAQPDRGGQDGVGRSWRVMSAIFARPAPATPLQAMPGDDSPQSGTPVVRGRRSRRRAAVQSPSHAWTKPAAASVQLPPPGETPIRHSGAGGLAGGLYLVVGFIGGDADRSRDRRHPISTLPSTPIRRPSSASANLPHWSTRSRHFSTPRFDLSDDAAPCIRRLGERRSSFENRPPRPRDEATLR